MTIILSGCNKVEKDTSFETDLYGTYSVETYGTSSDGNSVIPYELHEQYTFNNDNTYEHSRYEKIGDTIQSGGTNVTGKILNQENMGSDILRITLDNKDSTDITLDKYKNMIGSFEQADIPNEKTFDLFINDDPNFPNSGMVFSKDGYYHHCSDYNNCTDSTELMIPYKHKNDIIYQVDSKGNLIIMLYVTNDGLFYPSCLKTDEYN